jgi:predicted esterase
MNTGVLRLAAVALLGSIAAASLPVQGADRLVYSVAPNEADPLVRHFLHNSVVMFDSGFSAQAPLMVFLPGTGGDPARVELFLAAAAAAGYRAIGLSYDNEPAVMQVCARISDPACSENFRESRLFGGTETPKEESIVARLTRLLQFLDSRHPDQGWGGYLVSGLPDWRRIAVAGHSQGGGMAALLAKRVVVARVALLSGPPDFVLPSRQPASWLATPAATPIDRWYALYHRDEQLAPLLQRAYAALGVAAGQIRMVSLAPATALGRAFPDAYHISVVADRFIPRAPDGSPAYSADWDFLLGRAR